MENLTFGFNTVIGLLGFAISLFLVIFNRTVSDVKQLESWQRAQDERLKEIEQQGSIKLRELEMCIEYIKKEIDRIKKRKNAKS